METWKREIKVTHPNGTVMTMIEIEEDHLSIVGAGKFYSAQQFEAGREKLIAAGGKIEERANPAFSGWK